MGNEETESRMTEKARGSGYGVFLPGMLRTDKHETGGDDCDCQSRGEEVERYPKVVLIVVLEVRVRSLMTAATGLLCGFVSPLAAFVAGFQPFLAIVVLGGDRQKTDEAGGAECKQPEPERVGDARSEGAVERVAGRCGNDQDCGKSEPGAEHALTIPHTPRIDRFVDA